VIEVDVTGLDELISDLDRAAKAVPVGVRTVVQKGALNIKKDWQQRWTGLSSAPSLAAAVSYDTKEVPFGASAEIGPDKARRQGALGNLLEFGSVNNAPHPGGLPALEAEAPRFEKALGDLVEKLLNG
jgi:hypothetical protein